MTIVMKSSIVIELKKKQTSSKFWKDVKEGDILHFVSKIEDPWSGKVKYKVYLNEEPKENSIPALEDTATKINIGLNFFKWKQIA